MNEKGKPRSDRQVVLDALESFWATVAGAYPEATTGDLDPMATMFLEAEAVAAVAQWKKLNIRQEMRFKLEEGMQLRVRWTATEVVIERVGG